MRERFMKLGSGDLTPEPHDVYSYRGVPLTPSSHEPVTVDVYRRVSNSTGTAIDVNFEYGSSRPTQLRHADSKDNAPVFGLGLLPPIGLKD